MIQYLYVFNASDYSTNRDCAEDIIDAQSEEEYEIDDDSDYEPGNESESVYQASQHHNKK